MSEPTSVEEQEGEAPAVKAVVFDVGRVIVQWQLRHLVAKVVETEDEVDWVCSHVITEHWHFQHDAGRPLSEMIPERKALFPSYAEVIDHYAANFTDSIPGPVPGTGTLIERLAAKDVPLFAITNFGADFWQQFLPTEPLLAHMRDIVVSGVERVAKPDPRIFRLAEKRFGFAPESMLFIDDNAANVAGAQALGWRTHHFTAAEALEAELAAHGLI
ncbi:HAD family hydrolase [Parerythrobacter aestuarii]|uniref:HAD family hydrolase n=1 Tax=Parerythrobacter aestuarii TaxID=3020909 RepID=UPI0024DE7FD2|nr:HAD family phosphatase [Parerythrobacter aestuarii]